MPCGFAALIRRDKFRRHELVHLALMLVYFVSMCHSTMQIAALAVKLQSHTSTSKEARDAVGQSLVTTFCYLADRISRFLMSLQAMMERRLLVSNAEWQKHHVLPILLGTCYSAFSPRHDRPPTFPAQNINTKAHPAIEVSDLQIA